MTQSPKPGDRSKNVSTKVVPDRLLRLFALFLPSLNDIAARPGRNRKASNVKAKKLLNRQPRNHEEAILAATESCRRQLIVFIHLIFSYEDLRFTGYTIGINNIRFYDGERL